MVTISKDSLKEILILEELAKLHATEARIRRFEDKYQLSFEAFSKKIKDREVFEEYDDFIEWKAYQEFKGATKQKIADIRDGNFQIS